MIRRLASNALQLALALAFLWVMLFIATTAHGGQLSKFDSSKQPLRRLRTMDRTAIRIARVQGRTAAGFPLRQSVRNVTAVAAYGAGTAYRLSGWVTPGGILGNILFRGR